MTHSAAGCGVTPSTWTRRLATSSTNSTCSRCRNTVSTVKKSTASTPLACAQRNCRQVSAERFGAGPAKDGPDGAGSDPEAQAASRAAVGSPDAAAPRPDDAASAVRRPLRTRRPVNPNQASRAFARLAAGFGLDPSPRRPRRATRQRCFRSSEAVWQGQDSNLCRRCRRSYSSHRRLLASPVPSHLVPTIACDVHKRFVDSFGRHSASRLFQPVPHGLALGGGKLEGNPGCHLTRVPLTSSPRSLASGWSDGKGSPKGVPLLA